MTLLPINGHILDGDHPKGYFTYTNSGIVNLNGSAEKPLVIPADFEYTKPLTLGAMLDNAWVISEPIQLTV